MRVLMIQPNYHCGGAGIAGNWPPGRVAYIDGALKHAVITNIRFVDAMSNDISDAKLAEFIWQNAPDVVLATAITPMIYRAQKTLEIAKQQAPRLAGADPGCAYFAATFQYLFQELVTRNARVDETTCQAAGQSTARLKSPGKSVASATRAS